MTKKKDAMRKSVLLSDIIRRRDDQELIRLIEGYTDEFNFFPLEKLMISEKAWKHTKQSNINPKLVFAHPDLLFAYPKVSQHYRGIALIPQKQMPSLAASVTNWEDGSRKTPLKKDVCLKVARLYNMVISTIIEDSSNWTLENGYRNILVTMGIRLDGMYRNNIGKIAEQLIKNRISKWLDDRALVVSRSEDGTYNLVKEFTMRFGSEPDVKFDKAGKTVATIEVKGGKDPAGALERLGAMQKSFAETPPGCTNILVAGVVTNEMRKRLDQMGVIKVYLLNDLAEDGNRWDEFTNELFHHTVRII